ncbi:NnrU family protein [Maritalea porphyrae]|uniref:NnrU domain-containing protein n=1 Tax=Maritalea porphyrae TaxID=880732 RepID=A0ABQ5UUG6_9HYPH|nr:NnrU family protein [Maritalea porphyrae]GLQ18029.1 hypothetical protein GCM10007879_22780 [Maritalea porphyrae]
MLNFAAALIAFLAAHVVPRATGFRDWGIERVGRKAYMTFYSVMSLALLAWLVIAALNAPYIGLWMTTQATAALAIMMMLVSCILFATGVTRANSLSISFRGGETDIERPGILALVRHPIILGFLLWSAAHLLVNGDVVGVILFGGMLLFSVLGMRIAQKRAEKRLTDEQIKRFHAVAAGPLRERIARAASPKLYVEIVAGLAFFFLLLFGHEYLIGVSPLAYF